MRRVVLSILLAACLRAGAQSTPNEEPALTMRKNSHLVVLDVVVTDNKQNPIRGLKAQDFVVLDKKQPQTILNFEEHEPLPRSTPQPLPKLPPNTFTNYTPVPENQPLNILLLDAPQHADAGPELRALPDAEVPGLHAAGNTGGCLRADERTCAFCRALRLTRRYCERC